MATTRHSTYYWDPVVFKVEDMIYKVPRYQFEKSSEVFAAMFTLPQSKGSGVEGVVDENPILLDGIKRTDWDRFLEALYPTTFPYNTDRSVEEWVSIFRLSGKWEFQEVHKVAMREISKKAENLDSVELVLLGQECDVPKWVRSGYHTLATREKGLSLEEARKLGLENTLWLSRLREHIMHLIAETNHIVAQQGAQPGASRRAHNFGEFKKNAIGWPGMRQMIDETLKDNLDLDLSGEHGEDPQILL